MNVDNVTYLQVAQPRASHTRPPDDDRVH